MALIPKERGISNRSLHRVIARQTVPAIVRMTLLVIENIVGGRKHEKRDPVIGDQNRET